MNLTSSEWLLSNWPEDFWELYEHVHFLSMPDLKNKVLWIILGNLGIHLSRESKRNYQKQIDSFIHSFPLDTYWSTTRDTFLETLGSLSFSMKPPFPFCCMTACLPCTKDMAFSLPSPFVWELQKFTARLPCFALKCQQNCAGASWKSVFKFFY